MNAPKGGMSVTELYALQLLPWIDLSESLIVIEWMYDFKDSVDV